MTIDSYRNFVTIVDCGSIIGAANKLLIAQPSLSNQLKNIEKNYGATLLIRNNRGLELTDAGRIFYQRAKEITNMEEALHNEIMNNKTGYSDLLKLSIPAGNSPAFLHKFFDPFIAMYPSVNFDFYEIPSEFVIPNVLNGVTEIGLIRSSLIAHNSLAIYPFEHESIVAVFPSTHPLHSTTKSLTIQQLSQYPLAIPFDCLDIVQAAFSKSFLAPNVSIITSPKTTAIEWARSFGCVALISLAKDDYTQIHDLCYRKIQDKSLYVTSAFITKKDNKLSPVSASFLKVHGIL